MHLADGDNEASHILNDGDKVPSLVSRSTTSLGDGAFGRCGGLARCRAFHFLEPTQVLQHPAHTVWGEGHLAAPHSDRALGLVRLHRDVVVLGVPRAHVTFNVGCDWLAGPATSA